MDYITIIGDKEHGVKVIGAQENEIAREKLIDAYENEYRNDGWNLDTVTHNIGATKYHLYFTRPLV